MDTQRFEELVAEGQPILEAQEANRRRLGPYLALGLPYAPVLIGALVANGRQHLRVAERMGQLNRAFEMALEDGDPVALETVLREAQCWALEGG